ncbi:MAG: hypothetical protein P4L55_13155 [Syntrophobacteraceae bacterium]|nr:hypothetical protein [Syntrophobacteraceae bacterium]
MRSEKYSWGYGDRRFFSLLLSALLFLLTCFMPLCHTCDLLCMEDQEPTVSGALFIAGRHAGSEGADTDGPCLACLFLKAINATRATLFFFLLTALIRLLFLPFPKAAFPGWRDLFSAFPARGPPQPLFDFGYSGLPIF